MCADKRLRALAGSSPSPPSPWQSAWPSSSWAQQTGQTLCSPVRTLRCGRRLTSVSLLELQDELLLGPAGVHGDLGGSLKLPHMRDGSVLVCLQPLPPPPQRRRTYWSSRVLQQPRLPLLVLERVIRVGLLQRHQGRDAQHAERTPALPVVCRHGTCRCVEKKASTGPRHNRQTTGCPRRAGRLWQTWKDEHTTQRAQTHTWAGTSAAAPRIGCSCADHSRRWCPHRRARRSAGRLRHAGAPRHTGIP